MRIDSRHYDIFRYPAGKDLTDNDLAEFIGVNDRITQRRYLPLINAYNNEYKIFKAPRKASWKPDNRISANFAQYITDTFEGFFLGNGVKITGEDTDLAREFDAYNSIDDKNAEVSRFASIYGRAYEIYYIDTHGQQKTAPIDPTKGFMIYDEGLDPEPLYFVYTYTDYNGDRHGSISNAWGVRYFDLSPSVSWTSEWQAHGYDGVPATEYVQNSQRRGIFESVLPLIDAYNRALSEKADDLDAFSDAYLKVIGARVDEETIKFMRTSRVINFDGLDAQGVSVEFMAKPDADASQEHFLDRLEKLIFTIAMVCNVSDTSFATTSGIALQYKTMPMLNLMAAKKLKFCAGLSNRYRLVYSNPISTQKHDGWLTLSYTITPGVPEDIAGEADAVAKLSGITSRETQLARLPFVDDPTEELKRIEKEDTGADYNTLRALNDDNERTEATD